MCTYVCMIALTYMYHIVRSILITLPLICSLLDRCQHIENDPTYIASTSCATINHATPSPGTHLKRFATNHPDNTPINRDESALSSGLGKVICCVSRETITDAHYGDHVHVSFRVPSRGDLRERAVRELYHIVQRSHAKTSMTIACTTAMHFQIS